MQVETIKTHKYGKEKREVGSIYEAIEQHGRLLVAIGFVKPIGKRRTYKRRDMQVEG